MFALHKAKQAIRSQNYAVVVEGNMDAISCHQAGFKNVVACSGTALTTEQLALLKRYTSNIMLCLDADEAGQTATMRSIDLCYEFEMNVKVVKLLFGKDPDECLKKDPELFSQSLKAAKPPMQFYIEKLLVMENLSDVYKLKRSIDVLLQELKKMKNQVEVDHWLEQIARLTNLTALSLRQRMNTTKITLPKAVKNVQKSANLNKNKDQEKWERILTILLNYTKLIAIALEMINEDIISFDSLNKFYKQIILCYNAKTLITAPELLECLEKNIAESEKSYLHSLSIYINKIYENFCYEDLSDELKDLIKQQKIKHWRDGRNALAMELNTAKEKVKIEEIMKQIQIIDEKLSKYK